MTPVPPVRRAGLQRHRRTGHPHRYPGHGARCQAPRVGFVPFPYNLPMGRPHDREGHRQVALAALALLYEMDHPGEVAL